MKKIIFSILIILLIFFTSIIKNSTKDIDAKIYEKYSDYLSDNNKEYIIGATGCKLSHLGIIKDALKNNYENVLIFEDDITFIDNFIVYLNDFINKVSNMNWDMLYLGGNVAKVQFSKFKDYLIQTNKINVYKCKNFKCTHAYIINKKLFTKIIKDLETYNSEIDNSEYDPITKQYCIKCTLWNSKYLYL